MKVFKPIRGIAGDMLNKHDEFYTYNHLSNGGYSLCGVGDDEWEIEKPMKKVTCPDCWDIINLCNQYLKSNALFNRTAEQFRIQTIVSPTLGDGQEDLNN